MISYLQFMSGVLTAVIGWFVVHCFTLWREIKANRRRLITDHLVHTLCALSDFAAAVRQGSRVSQQVADSYNSANTIIQLMGNHRQIDTWHSLTEGMLSKQSVDAEVLADLMNDLRNELRKELRLEAVGSKFDIARVVP